jgi:hypothetical protein
MKTIELRCERDVVEKMREKYYWRFYKDALGGIYYIHTYFDECGCQYDTPIPISIKNKNTIRIKICKKDLEKFMRDDYSFNMTVESIKNDITEYINNLKDNLKGKKPE